MEILYYYTHRISVISTVKNIIRIETYTLYVVPIRIGNNNNNNNIIYCCIIVILFGSGDRG